MIKPERLPAPIPIPPPTPDAEAEVRKAALAVKIYGPRAQIWRARDTKALPPLPTGMAYQPEKNDAATLCADFILDPGRVHAEALEAFLRVLIEKTRTTPDEWELVEQRGMGKDHNFEVSHHFVTRRRTSFESIRWDYLHWTSATFDGLSMDHYAKKLRKEVKELCPDSRPVNAPPLDHAEIADVFLLLIGYCDAAGLDLLRLAREKLAINQARTWTKQPDGTYQHNQDGTA